MGHFGDEERLGEVTARVSLAVGSPNLSSSTRWPIMCRVGR